MRRTQLLTVAGSLIVAVSCHDAITPPTGTAFRGVTRGAMIVAGSGTWVAGPSMPLGKNSGATGVIDGKVYFAGYSGSGQTDLQVYDPAINSWSVKASTGARARSMGVGIAGKFYLAGGCLLADCNAFNTNLVEAYDPATNTWATRASMPAGRNWAASAVINDKWYVVGGWGQCAPCGTQDGLQTALEVYDPATDAWTTKAPLPGVRAGVAAVALNGKLYVAGTDHTPSGYVGHMDVYDPATNSWSALSAMPTPRTGSGLGVVDGNIYSLGGYLIDGGQPSTVEAYDPASDTWVAVAPAPAFTYQSRPQEIDGVLYVIGAPYAVGSAVLQLFVPAAPPVSGGGTWAAGPSMAFASNNGVSGVLDGKLYFAGAQNNGATVLQVLDPATNTWTTKASTGGRARAMGAGIAGKFYLAGGCLFSDCALNTNSVEAYDPVTNSWSAKASMPTGRNWAASAVIDGKWYVAGGYGACGPCGYQENLQTALEVYDPATDTWTTKAPMPGTRTQVTGVAVNGKFYVASTDVTASGHVGHMDVYDPVTNAWSALTAMPTPRLGNGLGVLDGTIYSLGGYLYNGVFPSAVEAYDPASDTWFAVSPIPNTIAFARPQAIDGVLYVVGTGPGNAFSAALQLYTPAAVPTPPVLTAPATLHAGAGVQFVLPLGFSHPSGAGAAPFTFVVRWNHAVNNVALSKVSLDPEVAPAFRRTYAQVGEYIVLATVTDGNGLADTTSTTVVVHGPDDAPDADVSAPTVDEGEDVVLDASASSDPNSFALSYSWQFDGAGAGSGSAVLVRKNVPRGTHTWRVIVRNSAGLADTASGSVSVQNLAPTGVFKWPLAAVWQNSGFTLSVTGVKDVPSDVPPSATVGVRFNCGSGYGALGTAMQVSCPGLGVNGSHAVGVKLSDQLGAEREYTGTVTIKNKAPAVTITGFQAHPSTPNEYRVLYTVTDGPNDGPYFATFRVNGVRRPGTAQTGTSGVSPFIYLQAGDEVTVRVTDQFGAIGSVTATFGPT